MGRVRIFKTSVNGREQVLAVNIPGESVAELPVFDGGPYPASAVAIEDTEITFISRRDSHAYCVEHPEVPLKVLSVVGARLRRLVGIIEELSFTTIRQRLIATLLKLAQSEGKKTERGIEFLLPATHQELVPIFRRPHQVIFAIPRRLAATPVVFHLYKSRPHPSPKGEGFTDPLSGTLKNVRRSRPACSSRSALAKRRGSCSVTRVTAFVARLC
jgi:CRP/FNR family transcriptional regulator